VHSLPPCADDMDLMIEAKDKEQAVFELRRKWNVEGGVPSHWYLTGEKMDEERDMPSEGGWKVYYGEGEEWRFKPPLRMPARVKKSLEKLEKQVAKIPEDHDRKGEIARIEQEKRVILAEWEKERRIKWGLDKKPEKLEVTETEEVGVVGISGKSTPRRGRKKEEDEMAEWTPSKRVEVKKPISRRKRGLVDDRQYDYRR
jgi:hypothetical protein